MAAQTTAEYFQTVHKYMEQSRTAPSEAPPGLPEMPVHPFHCVLGSGREQKPESLLQRF